MSRNCLQKCAIGRFGQAQRGLDILPGPHHLPGIVYTELPHQRPELEHRGRLPQVVDDMRLDVAVRQELPRRATL